MPPGFTRTEVDMYTTVSEQLRKTREKLKLTLVECAARIGIQEKYLSAIEASAYDELPGEMYCRAWVRKYAQHLGLSANEVMISYEKERQVRSRLQPTQVRRRIPPALLEFFTLRRLGILGIALVLLGYSAYLSFQTIRSPKVALNVPTSGFRTHENTITLTGLTESGTAVRINQQPITLDGDHRFAQEIALTNGLNTITLDARKKHSRTYATRIVIIKTPPPTIQTTATTTGP